MRIDSLFSNPDLYLLDVDTRAKSAGAICLRMSRETYSQSNFLDYRAISVDGRSHVLPLGDIVAPYQAAEPASTPVGYVAHTAFCGSTLLARCIDLPGVCLPYKEPFILHRLADVWRHGFFGQPGTRPPAPPPLLLKLSVALLARTYSPLERPVVKLTDSCISLCPDLLAQDDGSRLLLLYHDLEHHLVAMLKDSTRRTYCRSLTTRSKADLAAVGQSIALPDNPSDAVLAAHSWMGLMHPYLELLATYPGRVCSLNASTFFQKPDEVLYALARFFSLDVSGHMVETMLSGSVMSTDSKRPGLAFDSANHLAAWSRSRERLQTEIDEAFRWVETANPSHRVPDKLPSPLTGNY